MNKVKKNITVATAAIAGLTLAGTVTAHADEANSSAQNKALQVSQNTTNLDQESQAAIQNDQKNVQSASQAAESANADLSTAKSGLSSAMNAAVSQKSNVDKAQSNVNTAKTAVSSAQDAVNKANDAVNSATPEAINSAQKRVNDQEKVIYHDNQLLSNAKSDVDVASDNVTASKNAVDSAQVAVNNQAKAVSAAEDGLKNAQDALAGHNIDAVKKALNEAQEHVSSASSAVTTAEADLTNKKAKAESANKALNDARSQQSNFESAYNNANNALNNATNKLANDQKSPQQAEQTFNASGFFKYVYENAKSDAEKKDALDAYNIVTGQGEFEGKKAPDWYSKAVKLGSKDDATSIDNIKDALAMYPQFIKVRQQNALEVPKISLSSVAIAMLDVDYNVHIAALVHPSYYSTTENLAEGYGSDYAVGSWMSEKSIWDDAVAKNPELANHLHDGYWVFSKYLDLYEKTGHYLNFMDQSVPSYGFASAEGIQGYDADFESGVYSLDQYKDLLNNYIRKNDWSQQLNTDKANIETAKQNLNAAKAKLDTSNQNVSTKQNDYAVAQSNVTKAITALNDAKTTLENARKNEQKAQQELDAFNVDQDVKQKAVVNAQNELKNAQNILTNLNTELSAKKNNLKDTEDVRKNAEDKVVQLQATLRADQNKLDGLKQSVADLQNALENSKKAQAVLASVQQELNEKQAVLTQEQDKLNSLNEAVKSAQDEVNAKQLVVDQANAKLNAARAKYNHDYNSYWTNARRYGNIVVIKPITVVVDGKVPTPQISNPMTANNVAIQAFVALAAMPSTNEEPIPAGTTAQWNDLSQVKNDITHVGAYTEKVLVTFPDGTFVTVNAVLTVTPAPQPNNASVITTLPNGYKIVNNHVVDAQGNIVSGWTVQNGQAVPVVTFAKGNTVSPTLGAAKNTSSTSASRQANKQANLPQTSDNKQEGALLSLLGASLLGVLGFASKKKEY